jgi:predicted porin
VQDTFWAHLAYEKGAESIMNNPVLRYVAGSSATLFYSALGINTCSSSVQNSGIITGGSPTLTCGDFGFSTLRLTGGIDVGNIHAAFLAQQRDADVPSSLVKTESKNDYMVSGAYDLTSRVTLKGQFAQAAGYFLTKDDDRKIQSWTVGADYALGKNVTSYILYSANSITGKDKSGGSPGVKDDSEYNVASLGLEIQF